MRGLVPRETDDSGAVAAEYVGVLVVIAMIVAALLAVGIWQTAGDWAQYAVCHIVGSDGCARPSGDDPTLTADGEGPPPLPACRTGTTSRDRRTTTDWIFSRNVDGERWTMTELSDGSVVILDGTYAGDQRAAGVGFDVPLGAQDKLGISVSGHHGTIDEAGRMFLLTPEDLAEYQELMGAIARDQYVHGASRTAVRLGAGAESTEQWLRNLEALERAEELVEAQIDEHVTHDYVRTRDEVHVRLGGSYRGVAGAVSLGGGREKNIAIDRATGEQLITMRMDTEEAVQLGVGMFGAGAGVQQRGTWDVSVALRLSSEGELQSASLTAGSEFIGGGYVGVDPGSLPGGAVQGLQTSGGANLSVRDGGRVEATFSLDLASARDTDLQQLRSFLSDPVREMPGFVEISGRQGEMLLQSYDIDTAGSTSLELAARVIVQAGISSSDARREVVLRDALSYDPNHGLLRRTDCLG
jgi:hypothetical protein